MRVLLTYFDALLLDESHSFDYPVFNRVAELVSSADTRRRLNAPELWEWIKIVSRSADSKRRIALTISIFRGLVDEQIDWDDDHEWKTVGPLFEFWLEPETRWALAAAYEEFPHRLHSDFKDFIESYTRRGMLVLSQHFANGGA